MSNTIFLGVGALLLLLQANLFRVTAPFLHAVAFVLHRPQDLSTRGFVPSLVLPLILFMGVHEYSLVRGASVAFALGYLTDLMGVAPIGLYTSTYVAIYVLARAAGVRLAAQTVLMQITLALVFTLVHAVMTLVLLAIFGRDAWVPRALYPRVIPHVLATAGVAPFVFRLAARIHVATRARAARKDGLERGLT